MPIEEVRVSGYRSVRTVTLRLGPVTVVVGPNGCGKSNLYRAVGLLQSAADGRLARSLADEGGIASAIWAGERSRSEKARVTLGVRTDVLDYSLAVGFPIPGDTLFNLDGEVKEERLAGRAKGKMFTLMERKGPLVKVQNDDGATVAMPNAVASWETALAEVRDPKGYAALAVARLEFQGWRFYHEFRTDAAAPVRQPQTGCRTPVLAADGRDLAAALQTIREIGGRAELDRAIDEAFPGAGLLLGGDRGRFAVGLKMPEFHRPFEATELSDGTLRYLCLLAALLTPRPPALLAFNEPETSLHPNLLPPLARLIGEAARYSQIWVTTHSEPFAAAIQEVCGVKPVRLEKVDGATQIMRGPAGRTHDQG